MNGTGNSAAIKHAHEEAVEKVKGHKKNDTEGRLDVLLNHVNDTTEGILKSPDLSSDQKVVALQAFVDDNRKGSIAQLIGLALGKG